MRKKIGKEDWEDYSGEVKKFTGFKPVKYEWEGCLGCLTLNKELPKHPFFNFLRKCRTRKCTTHNEVNNCAFCSRFPCTNTVANSKFTREKISEKLGRIIDDKTYDGYIKMFDSMTNLKKIRSIIPDNQIKNPKPIYKKSDITKLRGEFKNQEYKILYEKLLEIANSNLGIKGIDTVSGLENYNLRNNFLWRFLWIIGLHGKVEGNNLSIDSATLYENRKPISLPSNGDQWKIYFDILAEFGINTELEIKTDKLYTPGGYMRALIPKINKPAYMIKMNLDPNFQEYQFFKALKEILSELQEKTGKRAFSNFKKLNFNPILS
jgi:hypothetical protein